MVSAIHHQSIDRPEARREASRLMLLILLGAAFLVNAFIAGALYPDNPLAADVAAAIGALILALPILWTAVQDLARGHVHMNELVALAVLAAFALGDFKTAGLISFFMLISLLIEARTAEGALASIESLIRLAPTTARRLEADGSEAETPAHELRPGDRVRVRPGDVVAADGRIVSGRTSLNEATITGESLPRDRAEGDEVFAGTVNLTGAIDVEVTRTGEDTTLGRVRELILAAKSTRLPVQRIIDRYARYYTPVVLMIAGLVWFFTADWSRVIAILVVACPCALILAAPTAMVAALSSAARLGILIKHVATLETAAQLNAFVFDKTGTLTTGELGVSSLEPVDGVSPSALLAAAAGAERRSNHPAALALIRLAAEAGLDLPEPADTQEAPGRGVSAVVDGDPVLVGRAEFLRERGVAAGALDLDEARDLEGVSMIFVARAGRYLGWIGLQDQVREEAAACIAELKTLQVKRLAMFTGDREPVARRVAADIDCPEYRAACLPQEKVEFVQEIRRAGYRVAVIGDGVNDAPALAAGDAGVAMGAAGSDVAVHSAGIALMNNDLRRVPFLLRLSRAARAVIYQNLFVGLLFIVGGLFLSGLGMLNPIVAAILHNAGSLIVVFNSARLVRSGEDLEEAARETA
jgi:Zn2+/Cd2+-exporting ATPase